jgi:hypothetical protein
VVEGNIKGEKQKLIFHFLITEFRILRTGYGWLILLRQIHYRCILFFDHIGQFRCRTRIEGKIKE